MGDLIVRVDELDLQRAKPANLGAEAKPGMRILEMHSVSGSVNILNPSSLAKRWCCIVCEVISA